MAERRMSGKKVLLLFGLMLLVAMIGITIFARVVIWPLMTGPYPASRPAPPPSTQPTWY